MVCLLEIRFTRLVTFCIRFWISRQWSAEPGGCRRPSSAAPSPSRRCRERIRAAPALGQLAPPFSHFWLPRRAEPINRQTWSTLVFKHIPASAPRIFGACHRQKTHKISFYRSRVKSGGTFAQIPFPQQSLWQLQILCRSRTVVTYIRSVPALI